MIYSGKGVVFLTAVKVRDIVSVGARPVFTEQKRFTTQLRSLPLSFSSASHFISLQCVARKAACSSSSWLVWSGWEDGVCGAVCCGLRFTTGLSLRQPPPWQPAVALAKAPTRCYPYRAVCGGMHPARGRLRWDHCFYFVCFFLIFSFIALNIPDDFSVCWFLFMALGSAQYLLTMPLGHPASHLIWSSGLGHLGVKTTPKQKH